MKPRIAFFGTPDYSLIILNKLYRLGYPIVCVVTKPPRPIGRKQVMTQTPVALWAEKKKIPVLTPASFGGKPWIFASEKEVVTQVLSFQPELLISADYTQKIPMSLVSQIKFGGLNVHPSLLPAYRGPAPVPWAIHNGESETGVSLVTLSDKFDAGVVVAQEKEIIQPTDTTDTLLTRLFTKGAQLLLATLPKYLKSPKSLKKTLDNLETYFPRLTRDTGFELWVNIKRAMATGEEAERIDRKWRAFHPWPGLWTTIKLKVESLKFKEKRLKILKVHLDPRPSTLNPLLVLDQIQLEGKNSLTGSQAKQFLEMKK